MKYFGTDGVRGLAGEFLDASLALKIGMALGIYFKQGAKTRKVIVGKDTRRSGYMLETAVVSGLASVGFNVLQIGPMPTPAISFLTSDMRCDFGIMISASHNPYEDNGIKVFDQNGMKLSAKAEQEIEAILEDEALLKASQVQGFDIGYARRIDDVIGRYIVHIKNSLPKGEHLAGLRVVIDCANGAGYKVAPIVFAELGADVFCINKEPNGANINEHCGAMHPAGLGDQVRRLRADAGFALDGDADRLVAVDEKGVVIDGDALCAILAVDLQERALLKAPVTATVMSNAALDAYLKGFSLELVRTGVGDKKLLESMQETGSNFGAEPSGHVIFKDFSKTGDGILAALQVAHLLVSKGKKASEIFAGFKPRPSLEFNVKSSAKPELSSLAGFEQLCKKLEAQKISHLFRYSGTQDLLRAKLQGDDLAVLKKALKEAKGFFEGALGI